VCVKRRASGLMGSYLLPHPRKQETGHAAKYQTINRFQIVLGASMTDMARGECPSGP